MTRLTCLYLMIPCVCVYNWPPAVWGTEIPLHLHKPLLIRVPKSNTYNNLVDYFCLPTCLLQRSGYPQTTNSLSSIP